MQGDGDGEEDVEEQLNEGVEGAELELEEDIEETVSTLTRSWVPLSPVLLPLAVGPE